MASRFFRGSIVYAKDGRSYVVEEIDDGIVYCSSESGAETEFPEAALLNETEWAGRSNGRRDQLYLRLRQARPYAAPAGKLDSAACERLLTKIERLSPGILDFAAFTVAKRIMAENKDDDLLPELSIVKCRETFDAVQPEIRAGLLAEILGTPAPVLLDAGRLGDNLMRAMIEKGLASRADDFDNFRDRRRR